ncbi:MAG: 2-phospho-L-lactate transferase [Anaerolineales bacterium]|nr:2-phospho-L-lactate transferase [Anaerolineales bacterium]
MKVAALAGGVGGAKLAHGLDQVLPAGDLTVIVNTGDDFEYLGLRISPDLDTVMYTLAGLADPEKGWGRADESWICLDTLRLLGGPTWFRLGDKDLALHLERTRRLGQGETLTAITGDFCSTLGVRSTILPMSDERVATKVQTEGGELAFQTYFVALRCEPEVRGFRFEGLDSAKPAAGVLEAIGEADLVVLCPSNPWVSLDPILAIEGVRSAVGQKPVVGVSPIIGGRALKGPAAMMYQQLGFEASALTVAEHYRSLLDGFVLDHADLELESQVQVLGLQTCVTQTVMNDYHDRRNLADTILEFAQQIQERMRST